MPEKLHPTTLLEDYSLGLLTPEELPAVEAHLASCEACRAEVRKLDAVLVAWGDSVPELQAPANAWSHLQARLQTSETEGSSVTAIQSETTTKLVEPPTDLLPEIAAPIVPHEPSTTRAIPPLPLAGAWFATTFCALLALASLVWGWRNQAALQTAQQDKTFVAEFLAEDSSSLALYGPGDTALGTVLVSDQEALFVLNDNAPERSVYQAWGHINDDWEPGSSTQLTSLELSEDGVFKVSTAGFSALYLSLEPPGGSPQPTRPIARVSLTNPVSSTAITIASPSNGSVLTTNSVIVRGTLSTAVRGLSYRLNGGDEIIASFTGTRFTFTVSGLQEGENRLELNARTVNGETKTEVLTLTYRP